MTDPFRAHRRTEPPKPVNPRFFDIDTGRQLFPKFACSTCGRGATFNFEGVFVHDDEHLLLENGQITVSLHGHAATIEVIETKAVQCE